MGVGVNVVSVGVGMGVGVYNYMFPPQLIYPRACTVFPQMWVCGYGRIGVNLHDNTTIDPISAKSVLCVCISVGVCTCLFVSVGGCACL